MLLRFDRGAWQGYESGHAPRRPESSAIMRITIVVLALLLTARNDEGSPAVPAPIAFDREVRGRPYRGLVHRNGYGATSRKLDPTLLLKGHSQGFVAKCVLIALSRPHRLN
jgi:hypothetical protein